MPSTKLTNYERNNINNYDGVASGGICSGTQTGRKRELTKIDNRVQRYNKNLHPMKKRMSKFAT